MAAPARRVYSQAHWLNAAVKSTAQLCYLACLYYDRLTHNQPSSAILTCFGLAIDTAALSIICCLSILSGCGANSLPAKPASFPEYSIAPIAHLFPSSLSLAPLAPGLSTCKTTIPAACSSQAALPSNCPIRPTFPSRLTAPSGLWHLKASLRAHIG